MASTVFSQGKMCIRDRAWTGALVAALLDIRMRHALPAIFLGVVIAGAIVTTLTYGVVPVSYTHLDVYKRQLQKLRTRAGLSQDQLAELLDVSRQAVSKWERNEAMPEAEKLVRISRQFGVSTDYLLLEELELSLIHIFRRRYWSAQPMTRPNSPPMEASTVGMAPA